MLEDFVGFVGVRDLLRIFTVELPYARVQQLAILIGRIMVDEAPVESAVAERFFQLLKKERVRRHVYATREEAHSDVFDYKEMFYKARRRDGFNNQLSPIEYEEQYDKRLSSV